ncbi:hypothetical protein [Nocardia sp. NPDC127526]|uniref:hypothetical protein n=1 Tax=Nocardia sp. NPDC127526 TaxID=3345393 RepID=UPI003625B4BE
MFDDHTRHLGPPLLRFVADDARFDDPEPAPAGWAQGGTPAGFNGALEDTPPDVLDPNPRAAGFQDHIHDPANANDHYGQPYWGSSPKPWNERTVNQAEMRAAPMYFDGIGADLAADLFRAFLRNNRSSYEIGASHVDEAVLGTKWARSALFFGQDRRFHPAMANDPRLQPDWMTLRQQDQFLPGDVHDNGIQDQIDEAIRRARADPSLYGKPQQTKVPWMRTPYDANNDDNFRVNLALGHYHLGAVGAITVYAPDDPDHPNGYEATFNAKIWDYYNFPWREPRPDDSDEIRKNIERNNQANELHSSGVARNFIDFGTSNTIVQRGTIGADGRAPRDFEYTVNGERFRIQERNPDGTYKDRYDPANNGGVQRPAYAAGGSVQGPGSSIGDKIPAWLSDGEFVMNARSTSVNRPFLQALNADPFFLQTMLAQRDRAAEARASANAGAYASAPSGNGPATVNISMSSSEDIVARLKVLSTQWELMNSR